MKNLRNLTRYFRVALAVVVVLMAGCDKSSTPTTPLKTPVGIELLGLINNRTLEYIQTDTIINFVPEYSLDVISSTIHVKVTGADDDWVISDGADPLVNLKVSDPYVLINGFWLQFAGGNALIYFNEAAILMTKQVDNNTNWTAWTPPITTDSSSTRRLFQNCYFGFYSVKRYVGTESLLLPAGSFETAYRFDVDLYLSSSDSSPMAHAIEYYVPSIGLVKLSFQGQGLTRTSSLVSYQ